MKKFLFLCFLIAAVLKANPVVADDNPNIFCDGGQYVQALSLPACVEFSYTVPGTYTSKDYTCTVCTVDCLRNDGVVEPDADVNCVRTNGDV